MIKAKTYRWAAAAASLALVLAACGGDTTDPTPDPDPDPTDGNGATEPDDGDDELEALIAAAQAEGGLVFYGAATENVLAATAAVFQETYGIQPEFLRMSSADLQQRFFAEMEAGQCVPDVVMQSDTGTGVEGMFDIAAREGYIVADLADAGIPGFPNNFDDEWLRGPRMVLHVQPWLFAYNSEIIDPADAPTQWDEWINPAFDSLILYPNPAASGAYNFVWEAIYDEYGEEWFEDFMALNPRLFDAGVPAAEAAGAGEGGIIGPAVGSQIQGVADRGAPLVNVVPDVTSGVEMSGALVDPDCSPNPNAGRLFLYWLMTPEGQAAFSDFEAVFSVLDTAGLPSGYVSPSPVDADKLARIHELLGVG